MQGAHRFGQFMVVRTLGRGGMGEVFVARTPWLHDPLAAVKRLRPDVARVSTFAERFRHEAELAVQLSHPRLVRTLDVGSVDGQLYVASELVFGKDTGHIADRLRKRGQPGSAEVAIRLMLDALEGLAYVHNAEDSNGAPLGLVHRDLTPGNVLVGYDGSVKLADFGLAKSSLSRDLNLTTVGEILGTPHYLAPEVVDGVDATPASDIYGLGAVLYRFLTGVPPHQGTTAEILASVLRDEPKALGSLRPSLDPWLTEMVHRMMRKDPVLRPGDAFALHAELQDAARDAGLLVPRDAVGQWLCRLFEPERGQELEEKERLLALPTLDVQDDPGGTVVLARPLPGARLEAPAERLPPGSEAQVGRAPSTFDEPVTQFEPGEIASEPPTGFEELMPTQAVRLAGLSQAQAEEGTDRTPAPAPRKKPTPMMREDTPAALSETELPGFVDLKESPRTEVEDAPVVSEPDSQAPHPPLDEPTQSRAPAVGGGRRVTSFAAGVALGLALGYAASTLVSARATGVQARLLRTRQYMLEAEKQGRLPEDAWKRWAEAAEKAIIGDVPDAAEALDELMPPSGGEDEPR